MESKFIDPPNLDYFISKLKTLITVNEICTFMENTFPGWFNKTLNEYSKDYPHLTTNWTKICSMMNPPTTPQKIVLVNWISGDKDHLLTREFCEYMTVKGYAVRRTDEFIPCKKCNRAIPDKEVWEKMKEHNVPCPDQWSNTCSSC